MTPTTTAAPRTIEEIDRDLAAAREAMSDAARELEAADAAVDQARQSQSIGLVARGFTLRAQVQRARRSETFELARARVTALEKLGTQAREAAAAERARIVAEKAQRFRAEATELRRDTADTLRQITGMLDNLEAAFRSLNERAPGAMVARIRPPSDFQGAWARVVGGLEQLQQVFDDPRDAPRPTISGEES